jgi:hypothetical protein
MNQKRAQSFPLRLSPSVRQQIADVAKEESISVNHFISLAVAEKLSRLEYNNWIRQNRPKNRDLPSTAFPEASTRHLGG